MNLFLDFIDSHSWATLLSIFLVLGLPALLGKLTWRRHGGQDEVLDDELKIVLGAALSLFGLLMGFILSIAIGGYNTRVTAEENEAMAIGNAFQRTTLLMTESHKDQAEKMLHDYLQLRIRFFNAPNEEARIQIRMESIQKQTYMWTLISQLAKQHPNPVMLSVLNACNDLYTTQQKTMASWRQQIPSSAWVILILFGMCSNFLIGYNMRGKVGCKTLLLVVPVITSIALFMIAEIDIPGRGMIHVTSHNLEDVLVTLSSGGLTQ